MSVGECVVKDTSTVNNNTCVPRERRKKFTCVSELSSIGVEWKKKQSIHPLSLLYRVSFISFCDSRANDKLYLESESMRQ